MPERFAELVRLMARLRALDGCPWDRKQTHDSLKPYLLEETYEVLETIDKQDAGLLREELGDLLLQILFHAQIAAEAGTFTIDDVMQRLAEKLVHRHPHIFDKDKQEGGSLEPEEVVARWEEIKRKERKDNDQPASPLDGVPKTLPALLRAFQLQARASRVDLTGLTTAKELPRSRRRSKKNSVNCVKRGERWQARDNDGSNRSSGTCCSRWSTWPGR